jgi:hypothetical protein
MQQGVKRESNLGNADLSAERSCRTWEARIEETLNLQIAKNYNLQTVKVIRLNCGIG